MPLVAPSSDHVGSTGGCRVHDTSSRPPPEGLTAQGGKKHWARLRRDGLDFRHGHPCDHAANAPAVFAVRQRGDASDSVIDRLLLLPVVRPQRQVRTVQTVQKNPEIPQGSSWMVVHAPVVVHRQVPGGRRGSDHAATSSSSSQQRWWFLSFVHRQGYDGLTIFFCRIFQHFSHSVHLDVRCPPCADLFGEPSTANSCWLSRARG